jgi:hypothetical protein
MRPTPIRFHQRTDRTGYSVSSALVRDRIRPKPECWALGKKAKYRERVVKIELLCEGFRREDSIVECGYNVRIASSPKLK